MDDKQELLKTFLSSFFNEKEIDTGGVFAFTKEGNLKFSTLGNVEKINMLLDIIKVSLLAEHIETEQPKE